MDRREGAGISYSLLQNPKKPQIWKLNMDIIKGDTKKARTQKDVPRNSYNILPENTQ